LSSFATGSDCPYYKVGHTKVNFEIKDGFFKGIYGPGREYFAMVEDFSVSETGIESPKMLKSFKYQPDIKE
jgi:hypothetical protein